MKKLSTITCLVMLLNLIFVSFKSYAWGLVVDNAVITQLIRWQGDESPLYIKINDEKWCYIPASEKNFAAYAMTLYVTKAKLRIHCRDDVVGYGGVDAHRAHRIVAK